MRVPMVSLLRFGVPAPPELRFDPSAEASLYHLAPNERDLRLERQVLRADVVAGKQRHAAKHAVVVADELVVVVVGARVARIEAEARDLGDADRADEIRSHARGAAGGHTATALDAAVELVQLLGEIGIHRLLDAREVDVLA